MHKFMFRAFFIQCVLLLYCINSTAQTTFTQITTGSVVNDNADGRGLSWVDYDNDTYPDLYVSNISNQNNCLYHNNGNGTFTQVFSYPITNDNASIVSGCWADYNNDYYNDVYLSSNSGLNYLYEQTGTGFLQNTSSPIGTTVFNSTHCSWADYDNDGYLDLFVSDRTNGNNKLFRNNGNSTFTEVITGSIVNDYGIYRGAVWADYNMDGCIDLYIASVYYQQNCLYKNNCNGTFTKITSGNLVTDFDYSFGASWVDYDNDMDFDLYICNSDNSANRMYRNNGNGTFTSITSGQFVTDLNYSLASTWGDFDNDGDIDLFVANGYTSMPTNNVLYWNNGNGTFTKELTGSIVNDGNDGQATACADIDKDGFLDIAVVNRDNQNNLLYRNDGNGNHWSNILLHGIISNYSAIGAIVRIKATINSTTYWQMRQVESASGYNSQNDFNIEFGLGDATIIDSLVISWPSGLICSYINVPVDTFLTYYESCGSTVIQTSYTTPLCSGNCDGTATVNVSGAATPYAYLWSNGSTDTLATGLCSGTYFVTVTDSAGVNYLDSVIINDPPSFTLTIYGYNEQCGQSDGSALASATGGNSPFTYYWNTGSTSNIITGLQQGTYYVTVIDANGCPDTGSVVVQSTPNPPVALLSGDTLVCQGEVATLNATGAVSYVWNTGDTGSTINVTPQVTSDYSVISSDGCGSDYDTITVTVVSTDSVQAGNDTVIESGGSAILFATGGSSYYWSPVNSLSCSTCPNPVAGPANSTTYYVWVIDDYGCARQDSVYVEVKESTTIALCDSLFVPNIFSPNNDGNNDEFYMYGTDFDLLTLQIYDRWGNKVFETDDQSLGWDGTYQSKPLNSAVFVWQIEAICKLDGITIYKKGNVTLVR